MKRRLGFVTNSSSTNSIIAAATTAVTSGIVSAVVNVDTSNEEHQVVETVRLILEMEASHPEKCLRLNDSEFTVNIFAAVKRATIHYVQSGGGLIVDKVVETYEHSQDIVFIIHDETKKWINTSDSIMVGDYKAMAVVGESVVYEKRHFQPDCPGTITIGARCNVGEYELSDFISIDMKDEALLFGRSTYALNDETVTTKVPIELYHGWPYDWKIDYDVSGSQLEEFCQLKIQDSDDKIFYNEEQGRAYNLVVTPNGKRLPVEQQGAISLQTRIDIKGSPSKKHIDDVKDFLDLILIEEGLFFEGKTDRKGSLLVESYVKSKEEDGPSDIAATRFKIMLVVKKDNQDGEGSTAEFLDMENVELKFDALIGTNDPSASLVQVYKYEIKKTDLPGTFDFQPLMSVPFSEEPLNVILPVSCEIDDIGYVIEMPIQIQGQPFGRPEAWENELKNLIHMIKNYVEPEKQLFYIEQIKKHQDRLSIESLRLRRRFVWEEARKDLLEEAKDHMATAEIYEWAEFGAGALKWAGDQAFAYLMNYWGGQMAELVIVPFKDIVVMLIGEMSAEYFFGSGTMTEEQMVTTSLNSMIGAIENDIMADFDFKGISAKKIGRYFGALASVNFLKHYFMDSKPDGTPVGFWDAIVSTCSDLSINFFKILVAKKFEVLIGTREAREFFSKYASTYVKDVVYKATNHLDFDELNTIGKYLSEITGVIVAEVNGEIINTASNTDIQVGDDDIIISVKVDDKVTVKISLMQMKDDLFEYMFDKIFGDFPFAPASKKLTMTAVPPYYR